MSRHEQGNLRFDRRRCPDSRPAGVPRVDSTAPLRVMQLDDWLDHARRDAVRRGLPALEPLLDMLFGATRALRAADWALDEDAGSSDDRAGPSGDAGSPGDAAGPSGDTGSPGDAAGPSGEDAQPADPAAPAGRGSR